MEKSELIKKWLDNDLSPQEFEAFKTLEDYDDLIKLSRGLKRFKAPKIKAHDRLQSILSRKKKINKELRVLKVFSRVAAVLLLSFGLYYFVSERSSLTTVTAQIAQKTSADLPDNSSVRLNASSRIDFDAKQWQTSRVVKLQGEAYFKVAKGAKFDVITDTGTVSVLGTEFNVKNRKADFEVICYEGSVQVNYQGEIVILAPGDAFKSGNLYKESVTVSSPYWINNESVFKSEPFSKVIEEFERQYNVTINTENINTEKLFTGKFSHNDIAIAIKAIALPFHLNYAKNGNTITLNRE